MRERTLTNAAPVKLLLESPRATMRHASCTASARLPCRFSTAWHAFRPPSCLSASDGVDKQPSTAYMHCRAACAHAQELRLFSSVTDTALTVPARIGVPVRPGLRRRQAVRKSVRVRTTESTPFCAADIGTVNNGQRMSYNTCPRHTTLSVTARPAGKRALRLLNVARPSCTSSPIANQERLVHDVDSGIQLITHIVA
jgi:hypothetical protein